jgi:hypothetical protein
VQVEILGCKGAKKNKKNMGMRYLLGWDIYRWAVYRCIDTKVILRSELVL